MIALEVAASEAEVYLATARTARKAGRLRDCIFAASVAAHHAERERNGPVLYSAYACAGRAHVQRDEPQEAMGWFRLAEDAARSCGLAGNVPEAMHDLFLCHRDTKDFGQAGRIAGRLMDQYHNYRRLPAFVADWEAISRHPAERWSHHTAFLVRDNAIRDRACAATNLMEICAALGEKERAASLWRVLRSILGEMEGQGGVALYACHSGAFLASVDAFSDAWEALQFAERLSEGCGEEKIGARAAYLLDYVKREVRPPAG